MTDKVRHHFEESYIARPKFSGGHKCELQRLIRKFDILGIIVCQERLERLPGGEIRNQNTVEGNRTCFPLSRIDSSMEVSTASMRSSISFGVRALVYSGSPSVGDPEDKSG